MIIAVKNLFRNKIRTLMTIAGAAVGIALFVALSSISNGFKHQIDSIAQNHKVDLAIQAKGAATPISSRISPELCRRIDSMEGIEETALVVLDTLKTPWNPYLIVMGISSLNMFTNHIRLVRGNFSQQQENEILIGMDVATFGYDVGHRIMLINDDTFIIKAIYTSEVKLLNSSVVLDFETARKLMNRDDAINMIFVRLAKGYHQEEVAANINSLLPSLYAVPTGVLAGQILLTRVTEVAALVVSVLAFIASCIVITNTLLMSITEKTKEIGVLMAIGWSRAMVIRLILTESLIICTAGMIVGNAAGYSILWIINYVNPEGMGWWITASFYLDIFLKSALIALLLGMASALYPAWVVTRLNPVQALRYE